jgi:maltose O-acetyltransferase
MIKSVIKDFLNKAAIKIKTPKKYIREKGGKVGNGVFIGDEVIIDYDYSFLLEIGDGAVISSRCIIELHDSCIPNAKGNGKTKIGKVIISDRVYIGVNSVLLPGIEIGPSAIIGACSLVNRNIPGGQVWAGVPAKFICTVDELDRKRKNLKNFNIAYFDWIGEIEKTKINYPLFKRRFIEKVNAHFEKRFNGSGME